MKSIVHLSILLCTLLSIFLFYCNNSPTEITPLVISVTADSTVAVRDTLSVYLTSDSAEGELTWFILFDEDWRIDSTQEHVYSVTWDFRDTGEHRVICYARSIDGRESEKDTLWCRITSSIPKVQLSADSVAYVNDTVNIHVAAADDDGTVSHLVWIPGNTQPRIITADTLFKVCWAVHDTGMQLLQMYAVDNDGQASGIDSLRIMVKSGRPTMESLTGDTLVSINDTVLFTAKAIDDNGYIARYQWMMTHDTLDLVIDGGRSLRWVWHYPDTGIHIVRVRALDDDGIVSNIDSLHVRVTADAPVLECSSLPVAVAGVAARYAVRAHDSDGKITSLKWTFETAKGSVVKTTVDTSVEFLWNSADIGTRVVTIVAIDDDKLQSTAVSCTLTVIGALALVADTVIATDDTLIYKRMPLDSAHGVTMWYFDTNGGAWDDSGTSALRELWYSGTSPVTVITGARYGAPELYRDTFTVAFNRAPEIGEFSLAQHDTIWTGEGDIPGFLDIPVIITDADNDSLSAKVAWGRGEQRDTIAFTDTMHLPLDSIGNYFWALSITDKFGTTVERSGTVTIGMEHTVCFAGHSIAVGLGDTTYRGGFRPLVLSALRDSVGPFERIRAVGPFSTEEVLMNRQDDSCFAVSGALAREMLLLMDHAYQKLTADIWVLMLGVNGNFSDVETKATIDMINRMVVRNPAARVYVLTSQPFNSLPEVQRYYYNNHIRQSVDSLRVAGYATFVVETGDSTLYDESTGEFVDSLAYDAVHPNTLGYHHIGDAIVKVMRERKPGVLDVKKEDE